MHGSFKDRGRVVIVTRKGMARVTAIIKRSWDYPFSDAGEVEPGSRVEAIILRDWGVEKYLEALEGIRRGNTRKQVVGRGSD